MLTLTPPISSEGGMTVAGSSSNTNQTTTAASAAKPSLFGGAPSNPTAGTNLSGNPTPTNTGIAPASNTTGSSFAFGAPAAQSATERCQARLDPSSVGLKRLNRQPLRQAACLALSQPKQHQSTYFWEQSDTGRHIYLNSNHGRPRRPLYFLRTHSKLIRLRFTCQILRHCSEI
ncbi:hypothetical protein Pst134EA_032834 [Puccinia striiformis f. sp. tritici]|uniref:uncharacterized protein n=1 Tax=Puccinia striiformis f. sp. tritici TaxID=168172 RepID=UPI002007AE43|nr:uncharacterized protein Pst134EA_032834 [Puccinia striiformis f. sp. tritici]KAH9441607.1 hypothetical protein Pst134EA_032834 [Puccinia striiformis f. sp. tritici]